MPIKDPEKRKEYARQHYLNNKAKYIEKAVKNGKEWRKDNPERIREYKRRDRIKAAQKLGREYITREQIAERAALRKIERRLETKNRLVRAFTKADDYCGLGQQKWYYHNRIKTNPRAMLDMRYRVHVRKALRGMNISLFDRYMGYSSRELREHIRRSMPLGMCWDDVLSPRVHIDHIIPRSAFDYESEEDPAFKACWSLKNMQPLWDHENRAKGNKL